MKFIFKNALFFLVTISVFFGLASLSGLNSMSVGVPAAVFAQDVPNGSDGGGGSGAGSTSRQIICEANEGYTWTGSECVSDDDGVADLESVIVNISNILLSLIGVVAVVMLIIGGFRYVAAAGDSKAIEGAKNTILYAIIGIVVAFSAWASISFVTNQLGGGTGGTEQTDSEDDDSGGTGGAGGQVP